MKGVIPVLLWGPTVSATSSLDHSCGPHCTGEMTEGYTESEPSLVRMTGWLQRAQAGNSPGREPRYRLGLILMVAEGTCPAPTSGKGPLSSAGQSQSGLPGTEPGLSGTEESRVQRGGGTSETGSSSLVVLAHSAACH